jgi:hypothetical protein
MSETTDEEYDKFLEDTSRPQTTAVELGSHYLKQGRMHRVPLESIKAWRYVESLFTLNPGMEIAIKRVGNFLEIRRIEDGIPEPASD